MSQGMDINKNTPGLPLLNTIPISSENFAQTYFTSVDKKEPTHVHSWDDEDNRIGPG
jgi:hypothetical protein